MNFLPVNKFIMGLVLLIPVNKFIMGLVLLIFYFFININKVNA